MTNAWKMRGGIASEGSNDKTADELTLANLQNNGKKGFQGNCNTCGKKGHEEADCRAKKDNGNKTNPPGGGNKKTRTCCHRKGHTESECYRKPWNPEYEKFKSWTPKGTETKKQAMLRFFL